MSFPAVTRLVAMHGVGDAYLTCALARAFEAEHHTRVVIHIKAAQRVVAAMFALPSEPADAEIARAETDIALQQSYPNDADPVFVHPSFVRTPARLDQLTVKPSVSQADMYRAILRVSPWTPLAISGWPPPARDYTGCTLLIPNARSWPNADPAFWYAVIDRLRQRGERVVTCEPTWTLEHLFAVANAARRVIGAQCGVMAVICEKLQVRKTIAVTELQAPLLFGLTATLPYGGPSTFAGTNHPDVKVVVVPQDWGAAVEAVTG